MAHQPPPKKEIREQLDADVKTFLRKGGKVDQIDHGKTAVKSGKSGAFILGKSPEKEQHRGTALIKIG